MKRTFKKIENEIDYEYPDKQEIPAPGMIPGPGDGPPVDNDLQIQNEQKASLTYKEAERKMDKRIIQEMLKRLVDTESGKRKIGRDYYDKKAIARDYVGDIEFKIPDRTYSLGRKPMTIYLDFTPSCSRFSGMFAEMGAALLENGAVIYVGGNGYVEFRIDKAPKGTTAEMIENALDGHYGKGMKVVEKNCSLEEAIKEDKVKRLFAYTDFDSAWQMVKTSKITETIWFSAAGSMHDFGGLDQYKGKFFQALTMEQIKKSLKNINDPEVGS